MAEQITTAAELLAAYAAGRRDFHGANLTDANLYGADLRGATLRGAILYGAILTDANLSGADLTGATLSGANLYGADLSGANLYGADLSGATLTDATLRGATLRGATLRGAILYGATLTDANLYGATLSGANLRGAILRGAKKPPVSSHDFIAEALRQRCESLEDAPENDAAYEQWAVAGLVLVSRDLCWSDFGYVATHRWTAETRRWVVDTLGHWPEYMTMLRRYGFVDDQTAGKTNADEQQADDLPGFIGHATPADRLGDDNRPEATEGRPFDLPSPQEAAEAAEWMGPDDQDGTPRYLSMAEAARSTEGVEVACVECGGLTHHHVGFADVCGECIERHIAEERESDRKRNANAAAIADGMAPPYPSEY